MEFYAHSHPQFSDPKSALNRWEPLFTPFGEQEEQCKGFPCCERCRELHPRHGHLNKVAWWTAKFLQDMFPDESEDRDIIAEWGYVIGLLHDLGKFSPEWQDYLKKKVDPHADEVLGKVDHSTAGAQYVVTHGHPLLGHLMAYGIAGHHTGLLDSTANSSSCQAQRLMKQIAPTSGAPQELLERAFPHLPPFILERRDDFSLSFFTRLLYSALVDADFLATESFMNKPASESRSRVPGNALQEIEQLVSLKMESFGTPTSSDLVNQQRARVVNDCIQAADREPGLFSLTVPTGGGKTLSSFLFALKHALKHGQKRIIYVVPFTSIIEQNADVIREIVSPLESDSFTPLIEHHSSLSEGKETDQSRLATENWDAPIIITTAVQFYESCFASRTSQSRKVHRVANSVIIFDEAQTIPVGYLHPCLRLIQELTDRYHTTAVLCTATQPAIHYSDEFPIGLKHCQEIVSDPHKLFNILKRVSITYEGSINDSDLASRIQESKQCLCVVNRRKHAQKLFQLLPEAEEDNFHLSALMCPQHRAEVLATVRLRLKDKLPVRLISTQLIEAGVDVDFPIVYRSLAGVDSIAQAAGRCNREGKMGELGRVVIFDPEDQKAESYFRETAQVASQIISLHDDILGMKAIRHFFDLYYYKQKNRWDEKGILSCFRLDQRNPHFPFAFDYQTASRNLRFIDEDYISVLIPYDDTSKELISTLKNPYEPLSRQLLRGLQRYTVQIFPKLFELNKTVFEELREGQFKALISPELNYSNQFGLCLDEEYSSSRPLIT